MIYYRFKNTTKHQNIKKIQRRPPGLPNKKACWSMKTNMTESKSAYL